jgi:hypothetical protein
MNTHKVILLDSRDRVGVDADDEAENRGTGDEVAGQERFPGALERGGLVLWAC